MMTVVQAARVICGCTDPVNSKNVRLFVIYEYQKGRNHELPLAFYQDYNGVLVTDGLKQYHLLQDKSPDLTNANCWAHARRDYADAIKAADKADGEAVKRSIAYQALRRIALIYELEGTLKDLTPEKRLQERQNSVKPLVEEYFTWVKKQLSGTTVLPKGKTADALKYSVNQEPYLKVFLEDGNVPIDNSASERSILLSALARRTGCSMIP